MSLFLKTAGFALMSSNNRRTRILGTVLLASQIVGDVKHKTIRSSNKEYADHILKRLIEDEEIEHKDKQKAGRYVRKLRTSHRDKHIRKYLKKINEIMDTEYV